jgi:transcriptional regulator with XRE-family HTH domain
MEKKLTQENIANDLGISVTAYSKIERGKTNISITRMEQIAEALDVNILKIIHPEEAATDAETFTAKEKPVPYGTFDTVTLGVIDKI